MVARRSLRGETFDDHAGTQPAEVSTNRSMYSSGSQKRKRSGTASYSAAIGVARKTCSWWNFTVVSGRALIRSTWSSSIASVSPGSPRMKCAPTCRPLAAVISTGAAGAREVVAPVDGPERGVEGRFDAVFEGDIPIPGQPGEVIELALVDAVGARAGRRFPPRRDARGPHRKASSAAPAGRRCWKKPGNRPGSAAPNGSGCGGIRSPRRSAADALRGHAIRRGERSVVTERTPSLSDRPVAVGAGEARIDGKFLHPAAEQTAEVPRIGVEPPRIAPRVSHRYKPQSEGL